MGPTNYTGTPIAQGISGTTMLNGPLGPATYVALNYSTVCIGTDVNTCKSNIMGNDLTTPVEDHLCVKRGLLLSSSRFRMDSSPHEGVSMAAYRSPYFPAWIYTQKFLHQSDFPRSQMCDKTLTSLRTRTFFDTWRRINQLPAATTVSLRFWSPGISGRNSPIRETPCAGTGENELEALSSLSWRSASSHHILVFRVILSISHTRIILCGTLWSVIDGFKTRFGWKFQNMNGNKGPIGGHGSRNPPHANR